MSIKERIARLQAAQAHVAQGPSIPPPQNPVRRLSSSSSSTTGASLASSRAVGGAPNPDSAANQPRRIVKRSVHDRLPAGYALSNPGGRPKPPNSPRPTSTKPLASLLSSCPPSNERKWGFNPYPTLSRPSLPPRRLPARAKRQGFSRRWSLKR